MFDKLTNIGFSPLLIVPYLLHIWLSWWCQLPMSTNCLPWKPGHRHSGDNNIVKIPTVISFWAISHCQREYHHHWNCTNAMYHYCHWLQISMIIRKIINYIKECYKKNLYSCNLAKIYQTYHNQIQWRTSSSLWGVAIIGKDKKVGVVTQGRHLSDMGATFTTPLSHCALCNNILPLWNFFHCALCNNILPLCINTFPLYIVQ